jgi:hypothetical protein
MARTIQGAGTSRRLVRAFPSCISHADLRFRANTTVSRGIQFVMISLIVVRFIRTPAGILFVFAWILFGFGLQASANPAATAAEASANPPVIVIGFVGGFVNHSNAVHREVRLAAQLRKDYPAGAYVQVFENHRSEDARQQILLLLDTDHDGSLSPAEKQNARIIIYGHSWGASESITLSRALERDGIPVLLTIQVDSITKRGEDDEVIPANVAQAVNFYQPDGILHGRPEIRAADPVRTQILGNFRFDYKVKSVDCPQYSWFARTFEKTHIEIESDPRVWDQVDSLIRAKLPTPIQTASVSAR